MKSYEIQEFGIKMQAALLGLWVAGGTAPWAIRLGVLFLSYFYFHTIFQGPILDSHFGETAWLILTVMVTYGIVRQVCRWLLIGVPMRWPRLSLWQLLLCTGLCVLIGLVWREILYFGYEYTARMNDGFTLCKLAMDTTLAVGAALPATFSSAKSRRRALWAAGIALVAAPWFLVIRYLVNEGVLNQGGVLNIYWMTLLESGIVVATIYIPQSLLNEGGKPRFLLIRPIDEGMEQDELPEER
ncbi:hypothetical protein [Blastopirellula marina]|nr:hypothetical protein [Blastopirellula marina]